MGQDFLPEVVWRLQGDRGCFPTSHIHLFEFLTVLAKDGSVKGLGYNIFHIHSFLWDALGSTWTSSGPKVAEQIQGKIYQ